MAASEKNITLDSEDNSNKMSSVINEENEVQKPTGTIKKNIDPSKKNVNKKGKPTKVSVGSKNEDDPKVREIIQTNPADPDEVMRMQETFEELKSNFNKLSAELNEIKKKQRVENPSINIMHKEVRHPRQAPQRNHRSWDEDDIELTIHNNSKLTTKETLECNPEELFSSIALIPSNELYFPKNRDKNLVCWLQTYETGETKKWTFCRNYVKHGICKYGSSCKFPHPYEQDTCPDFNMKFEYILASLHNITRNQLVISGELDKINRLNSSRKHPKNNSSYCSDREDSISLTRKSSLGRGVTQSRSEGFYRYNRSSRPKEKDRYQNSSTNLRDSSSERIKKINRNTEKMVTNQRNSLGYRLANYPFITGPDKM